MKNIYARPEITVAKFEANDVVKASGNGVDITEEALNKKGIKNVERSALSSFISFEF